MQVTQQLYSCCYTGHVREVMRLIPENSFMYRYVHIQLIFINTTTIASSFPVCHNSSSGSLELESVSEHLSRSLHVIKSPKIGSSHAGFEQANRKKSGEARSSPWEGWRSITIDCFTRTPLPYMQCITHIVVVNNLWWQSLADITNSFFQPIWNFHIKSRVDCLSGKTDKQSPYGQHLPSQKRQCSSISSLIHALCWEDWVCACHSRAFSFCLGHTRKHTFITSYCSLQKIRLTHIIQSSWEIKHIVFFHFVGQNLWNLFGTIFLNLQFCHDDFYVYKDSGIPTSSVINLTLRHKI